MCSKGTPINRGISIDLLRKLKNFTQRLLLIIIMMTIIYIYISSKNAMQSDKVRDFPKLGCKDIRHF